MYNTEQAAGTTISSPPSNLPGVKSNVASWDNEDIVIGSPMFRMAIAAEESTKDELHGED